MNILIDANILVRIAKKADAQRLDAIQSLQSLHALGHDPVIVPQVLYEFWVVATRPTAQNGLGRSADEVAVDFSEFQRDFVLIDDEPGIFSLWLSLMSKYGVLGKPAHDARLVAAMLRHGVTHLLTFNAADFARYVEIAAIEPAVAATLPPAS